MSRYGRLSAIRSATVFDRVRTDDSPSRTTGPPIPQCDGGAPIPLRGPPGSTGGSSVAVAALALMSGLRTVTPCRRASSTRDCGE